MVTVEVVAGQSGSAAGAVGERDVERLEAADLIAAQQGAAGPARLERPAVALQTEDVGLLTEGDQDVGLDRVADVRLDEWGRRVLVDVAAEDLCGVLVPGQPLFERFRPIIQADHTLHLLRVGHRMGADDLVLVLDEQAEVAVGGPRRGMDIDSPARSEEHTSELQSPYDLV